MSGKKIVLAASIALTHFVCHKDIHAAPMTAKEYFVDLKEGEVPEGIDPKAQGYVVVYSKDTDDEYISWSPKAAFDDGYTAMPKDEKVQGMMRFFECKNLPVALQSVSKHVGILAKQMQTLPPGAEKEAGMRKLLEAKDCFVRAKL